MIERTHEKTVLVLQGGGALGAYQGGVYSSLAEAGYAPEWVAGISIGAINGAIIAGNPPERRAAQLRRFWDLVSSRLLAAPLAADESSRRFFVESSAAFVASTGVPGFFEPRIPPAVLMPPGTMQAISIYDTAPLRATLLELIDFDLLNSGAVRLSVGAVQISTGNFRYFDTAKERIGPDHVMASGALPPGFPPVIIEGEAYWDGGIVSNTPLQYVLDGGGPRTDMCVFQIDLFSATGDLPQTLMDVSQREKEIRYSSRTRLTTSYERELQTLRRAVKRLEKTLPEDVKGSLDWRVLASVGCDAAITIVHLIHRRPAYATQSNDYEFSRFSVDEHWAAGISDVRSTLTHPAWISRAKPKEGVTVLDLTRGAKAEAHRGPAP